MIVLMFILIYVFTMSVNVDLLCAYFGLNKDELNPYEVSVITRHFYAVLLGIFATPFLIYLVVTKK